MLQSTSAHSTVAFLRALCTFVRTNAIGAQHARARLVSIGVNALTTCARKHVVSQLVNSTSAYHLAAGVQIVSALDALAEDSL